MTVTDDEVTDNNTGTDDKPTKILSKVLMITRVMKTVQDDVDEIKQKMVKVKVDDTKFCDQNGHNMKIEEKDKIKKAFEENGIGRPAGNFESKQKQYLEMLNNGKIKQPKEKTLEFYKIAKDNDDKYYLWKND